MHASHNSHSARQGAPSDANALYNLLCNSSDPRMSPIPFSNASAGHSTTTAGVNLPFSSLMEPDMISTTLAYQQVLKRVANTLPTHAPQAPSNFADHQLTGSNSHSPPQDDHSLFLYPSTWTTVSSAGAVGSPGNYGARHDSARLLQQSLLQMKPQTYGSTALETFVAMQMAGNMDPWPVSKQELADLPCGVISGGQHARTFRQTSSNSSLSSTNSGQLSGLTNSNSWAEATTGGSMTRTFPSLPRESVSTTLDLGCHSGTGNLSSHPGAGIDTPLLRQLQENNWLSAYGVDVGVNNCKPTGVLDKYSIAHSLLSQMVSGQAGVQHTDGLKRGNGIGIGSKLPGQELGPAQYPQCQSTGCTKFASKTSPYCTTHAGRRCQHENGCLKFAVGRTPFCIAHGGGQQCQHEGCVKSTQANTPFCIGHGGGRRCQHSTGCSKSAVGSTRFCKAHGGGRRCQRDNCTKSARGSTPYCAGHGGGRRCQHLGCTKSAVGSTPLCVVHGGGRRCQHTGCTRSAAGKTNFCITHGGGKPCQFDGCKKSAQAATPFCIAHGGGRRCQFGDGCNKLALSGTVFCKSHGNGPRCQQEGCTKVAIGGTPFCGIHKNKNLSALLVPNTPPAGAEPCGTITFT